ncbi:MAG: hypothetical protein LBU32_09135 [Clostridiales bacterium]|jgi:hypothetical protein|nr:hypothetical protein [Clostridiales bacterium]
MYNDHAMSGACMKKPGSFAFPCTTSVKIPSKRMAAGIAALGRKSRSVENEGFKNQKMQMHPAHRFSKNTKALKAHQRLIQVARCILQPPRRRSEAIQAVKRTPKDYNEMLKFKLSCTPIRLRREEADSGSPPVFADARLGMEVSA